MNKSAILIVTICLLATSISAATTPARTPTVSGVYENFTVGKTSGDLEGMRVAILPAAGGYYAIVQIAQGGPKIPNQNLLRRPSKE